MAHAFVHVTAESSSAEHAAREVAEIDAVREAYVVTGEYDVIALLDLDDPDALPSVVADEIQDCPPVVDTYTSVAYEPDAT